MCKSITPKYEAHADWGVLDLDGVRVTVYRYAESGQVFVSVNTEDAKHDNAENGLPLIFVELNDGVLWDGEKDAA